MFMEINFFEKNLGISPWTYRTCSLKFFGFVTEVLLILSFSNERVTK